MPSAIYLFKSLRAHTGLIVEDNKIILYEQKFFEIKRVIYSTKTILSYGVVDKKITAVRSRAYGGRAMSTMSFTSSKSSYKKKALVVKTKKTAHSWGKEIKDVDVQKLYDVFHEAIQKQLKK